MIFLSESSAFSLITPDPGLFLWSVIIFIILWIILGKYAFKPIMKALKNREESIANSLAEAERAREEMTNLTAQNEDIIKKAKEERNTILKDAQNAKDNIISDAKKQAKVEAAKIIEDAKEEILVQKNAVIADLKNDSANLAIDIAEQLLGKELSNKKEQEKYAKELAKKATF